MNKDRRKQIDALTTRINDARRLLADLADDIANTVAADEQDAFDNLPESVQGGERGQAMEAAISALEDAAEAIRDCDDALSSADELLQDARK